MKMLTAAGHIPFPMVMWGGRVDTLADAVCLQRHLYESGEISKHFPSLVYENDSITT